ncbi:MAG: hypothetical protein V4525_07830 [Pseudomonadota bacterium]
MTVKKQDNDNIQGSSYENLIAGNGQRFQNENNNKKVMKSNASSSAPEHAQENAARQMNKQNDTAKEGAHKSYNPYGYQNESAESAETQTEEKSDQSLENIRQGSYKNNYAKQNINVK